MDWLDSPPPGTMDGVVKAKVPGTLALPPESSELCKDWPAVIPLAVGNSVMVGTALVTTNSKVACPLPPLFAAEIVIVKLPAAVGVPERNPVSVSMASPEGRLPPEMVAL